MRPAQIGLLKNWNEKYHDHRDVVLKLHTGQGKTLVGLLLLQSKLNSKAGPVVYLCPNNFLVNQTVHQAEQFGVSVCHDGSDLPMDFIDGKSIFITTVHKMFNGLTQFGTGAKSLRVSCVLMDDAHACVDAIRNALSIKLSYQDNVYAEIRNLFSDALKDQGAGTFADLCNNNADALLPIPYWDWREHHDEVVEILSRGSQSRAIKFAWPILKDLISECQCVMSGTALEIAPYLAPLEMFGSFHDASQRIFMSATVVDDSFLVKGLRVPTDSIRDPLLYENESWSGEKMILIPPLIDPSLDRSSTVKKFGSYTGKTFGIVSLVPGYGWTEDWKAYGATIATKETIDDEVSKLNRGDFGKTLVIANRYDGIDLPDRSCRILIIDSRPHAEGLFDQYSDGCRATSEVTAVRTAKAIEQGLGRSVRGEKDYCVIVIIGPDLVKIIPSSESRKYLSNQTNAQIEIGLGIAKMAQDEGATTNPDAALIGLINQCLQRDEGWKEFYVERMNEVQPDDHNNPTLEIFSLELKAEQQYLKGEIDKAIGILQKLLDVNAVDELDRGWYLQEMARYKYRQSKDESNNLQISAHRSNRYLLKPRSGMQVAKLEVISQKRVERIITWVKSCETYSDLSVRLEDILSALTFGVKADRFEDGFNKLATALGFVGQRPDKEWKEGPDNLWGLTDEEYLVAECKSEVKVGRSEINKSETEQMNSSCAWFGRHYKGQKATFVMVIPTNKLANSAALTHQVQVIDETGLNRLKSNVRRFFAEYERLDFNDLSESSTQNLINTHELSVEDITTKYTRTIKSWK